MSSIIKGLRKEGYSAGAVGGAGLDVEEGQIYSTGGGAGQGYRKFTPKVDKIEEDSEYNIDGSQFKEFLYGKRPIVIARNISQYVDMINSGYFPHSKFLDREKNKEYYIIGQPNKDEKVAKLAVLLNNQHNTIPATWLPKELLDTLEKTDSLPIRLKDLPDFQMLVGKLLGLTEIDINKLIQKGSRIAGLPSLLIPRFQVIPQIDKNIVQLSPAQHAKVAAQAPKQTDKPQPPRPKSLRPGEEMPKQGRFLFDPLKENKSAALAGIEEAITDPEFGQKIKNITAMNPRGSADELMVLKKFLNSDMNPGTTVDEMEWIDNARQWLTANRESLKNQHPDLDFIDLDSLAQDMYVAQMYREKRLEEKLAKESSIMKGIQREADLKKSKELTNLDKEINDMIEKIWQTEKPEMFQDSGRYLVYASEMGVEMDTDNLDDALDTAEIIAKRNIRSPVVVVDRKTKFPVVAFHGSESLWYHQNRLHEEELVLEKWSKKYKKSIDCNNPKGFSQKAHCAGRKARQSGKQTKSKSISK